MSRKYLPFLLSLTAASLIVGCSGEQASQISYKSEVNPLIEKYCVECHIDDGEGIKASGFSVSSYETLMKGTKYGPVIVAGDAMSSSFFRLVSGKVDPSIQMPHSREAMKEDEIAKIETWIEQGAKNN
jgi:hypothetical protein